MATETENLLISLDIKGSEEELQTMVKLNEAIAETKAEIKRLGDTNKVESERNKTALKNQQKAYRDVQKGIQNQNKAANDNIKTLEGMRAKLSNMNKEITKLEVGSEPFKKMQAEAKKLKGEISGAEEGMGVFNRNVGNYENAITSAFQKMGININAVTGPLKAINETLKSTTVVTGETAGAGEALGNAMGKSTGKIGLATKALKIFKIALISTGIGAIVVALGFLVVGLSKMQVVTDKVNAILTPLANTMQRMIGIAQQLGSILGKILKGEAGWSDLGDAIGTVGDQMKEAYNEGKRIAELTVEIEQLEIKRIRTAAKLARAMNEQREILQNVNKSDKERKAAGEEFLRLQQEDVAQQTEIAKKEIERLEAKFKQNDTDREAQKELETARAKLDEIEATASKRRLEARNQINSIDKRAADERIRATEAQQLAEQKLYDQAIANITALLALADSLKTDENPEGVLFKLFDEEEIDDIPTFIDEMTSLLLEEQQLAKDTTESIKAGYAERLMALDELLKKQLISEEQYALRKRDINSMIMNDTIAAIRGAAAEGSKISQGLFLFEKILATRQAFLDLTAGLTKTASSAPFPANIPLIAGFIAQTVGLIGAIKGVVAPAPPKFAGGVIGLNGSGTETSDSISARLSRGESVLTAKATRAFAPQLAAMERAVGNEPNYQLGNRQFAKGFIPEASENTWLMQWMKTNRPSEYFMMTRQQELDRLAAKINDKQVFVYEQDISRTQRDVQRIKVAGDL